MLWVISSACVKGVKNRRDFQYFFIIIIIVGLHVIFIAFFKYNNFFSKGNSGKIIIFLSIRDKYMQILVMWRLWIANGSPNSSKRKCCRWRSSYWVSERANSSRKSLSSPMTREESVQIRFTSIFHFDTDIFILSFIVLMRQGTKIETTFVGERRCLNVFLYDLCTSIVFSDCFVFKAKTSVEKRMSTVIRRTVVYKFA